MEIGVVTGDEREAVAGSKAVERAVMESGLWRIVYSLLKLVEGHHVKNNCGVPTHVKRGQHQWSVSTNLPWMAPCKNTTQALIAESIPLRLHVAGSM